nr:hypothetical protein [Desulfobulbaceae bacterium]
MTNSTVISFSDIKAAQPISGWQEFLVEGQGFLHTASAAVEKSRKVFTPEILYNIIAMAIEKFVMAALMKHGTMPYNHTMQDLVEAMDTTFPHAIDELRDGLLKMGEYQDICDLDGFRITPPEMEDIPAMLAMAHTLKGLVVQKLTT